MRKLAQGVLGTAAVAALLLGGAASASAHHIRGAAAEGAAVASPGVLSGNLIQVPVHVPVNLCGNSIGLVTVLNPAFGNTCVNA
ncbi:chaplin [Kitasatospora sp. NBC_00315]|uniref:chaplin n=1 Tax=Kitasatospora sp. NBC_00315 TaxID=2975963 RepID=UPI0032497ECE